MNLSIRKTVVTTESVRSEAGRAVEHAIVRVTAAAVVKNPYSGEYHSDLMPLATAAADVAELLSNAAVAQLSGPAESYGKAAIVGLGGELEHAAAFLHPSLGTPLRKATGGGSAIIPSTKKCGPAGTAIDIPLHYKDAAYVRSHFDAVELRIPDAPRDDELVIAVAVTDGGRPHPRIGGLSIADAQGSDGLR